MEAFAPAPTPTTSAWGSEESTATVTPEATSYSEVPPAPTGPEVTPTTTEKPPTVMDVGLPSTTQANGPEGPKPKKKKKKKGKSKKDTPSQSTNQGTQPTNKKNPKGENITQQATAPTIPPTSEDNKPVSGFGDFAQIVQAIREISNQINLTQLLNFFKEAAEVLKNHQQDIDKAMAIFFVAHKYFFSPDHGQSNG